MTDHVLYSGGPGVLAGDAEPGDGQVMTQLQWLESLEGLSSHQQVLLKYSMRSQADVSDDLEMERWRAAAVERAEEKATLVALGLARARSHQEIFDAYSRACDIQDSMDKAQAAREARNRATAEAATFRQLVDAQQALTQEQQRSMRYLRAANDAHRARQDAVDRAAQSYRGEYFRTGGFVTGGPF